MKFHPRYPNTLVSCGVDGLFVWDLEVGNTEREFKVDDDSKNAHESTVECLCWAFGGTSLITGSKVHAFGFDFYSLSFLFFFLSPPFSPLLSLPPFLSPFLTCFIFLSHCIRTIT